jgi:hypothetical protein
MNQDSKCGAWSSRQEVAAHEICVFGHDYAAVKVRKAADFPVGRAVADGKITSVDGVVPDGGPSGARAVEAVVRR